MEDLVHSSNMFLINKCQLHNHETPRTYLFSLEAFFFSVYRRVFWS